MSYQCSRCERMCFTFVAQNDPHVCTYCKKIGVKDYDVEFWPGKLVEISAVSEEDALDQAIQNNGWIGGSENTGNGLCFKVWVREKKP